MRLGRLAVAQALRAFVFALLAGTAAFLLNSVLRLGFGWPGALAVFADIGALAGLQAASYVLALGAGIYFALSRPLQLLEAQSAWLANCAAYIIRFGFWAVFLIGLTDTLVSFLRVEGLLELLLGEQLTSSLGRANFRGPYLHYPLLILALFIAWHHRALSVIWLTLLVVMVEFGIVISRFVFSYEQALMGDLVRFWYAASFLFASAYTFSVDGHVRVDILYARFNPRQKAYVNTFGALLLGLPLCLSILLIGLWNAQSSIGGPLANFEISQSGYGLQVKYWMAGFLAIFAFSMIVQLCSAVLAGMAQIFLAPASAQPSDNWSDAPADSAPVRVAT